jgi:hypothetical protein
MLMGTATELATLPSTFRPGTMFTDETNRDVYVLYSDGVWRSVNKASSYGNVEAETSYEYHENA